MSGRWRGRHLAVPKDRQVRPTAERVREAWLNVLTPELAGARVLDLCAGTGALGLEALSRGASHATFVEMQAASLALLRANITTLAAAAESEVHRGDVIRFIAGLRRGEYDLALADPPFASPLAAEIVAAWQVVPFAAVLSVEHDKKTELPGGTTRRWGDIAVTFYRAP